MILFPNCKINIGLDILGRRPDGFHEIETVMFPVRGMCDILEMVESGNGIEFSSSGLEMDCNAADNLCVRAYELMAGRYAIAGVRMHLHKVIPFGAGLGGGSADGAFALQGLNRMFGLGLDFPEMESLAAQLGSDTAFFIRNTPQVARGRGEKLAPAALSLSGKTLLVVKPPISISTAEAYSGVTPRAPLRPLAERLGEGIRSWREQISNAFEQHIFAAYPELAAIKERLYSLGAVYAAMSGSGSAIYGIFDTPPSQNDEIFPGSFTHTEVIA